MVILGMKEPRRYTGLFFRCGGSRENLSHPVLDQNQFVTRPPRRTLQ